MSGRAVVIGVGCALDQLTPQARAALDSCDYVIAARKGDDDPLLAFRRDLCEQAGVELVAVPDPDRDRSPHESMQSYEGAVLDWHGARAEAWGAVIAERGGTAGFLVWGDPAYYDSTIRVVERMGLPFEVVPGVATPSLLAAAHGIVLHEVGAPVLITTGRRLVEDAATHDNLVVMLDGGLSCSALVGEWRIWWGANLAHPSERLVAGRLDDVLPQIERARRSCKAAAGWVMDVYLLRRSA